MLSLLRHLDDESLSQMISYEEEEIQSVDTVGPLTNEHLSPITKRNWKAVLSWTAFHPEEVSDRRDNRGQTALHHACLFKAPAYVVEALLYASPESASVSNQDGELPIHWAVRVAAPIEILRLLLNASPKCGLISDCQGETALSLIWDRFSKTLIETATDTSDNLDPVDRFKSGSRGLGWRMIMLFLRAYYHNTVSDTDSQQRNFRPLHASVGSPVPESFFKFVCSLYPNEMMERDDRGRLPLSVAAAFSMDNNNSSSSKTIIDVLLSLYPEAALTPDWEGRLPLVIAVESGKTWEHGVQSLFDAAPQALSMRDTPSRMYPFMLASVTSANNIDSDRSNDDDSSFRGDDLIRLNTTFRLLQADPECVRSLPH